LLIHLLEVVLINVDVSKRVNEIARFKFANRSHHARQQCIRRNIERYPKEKIGASLVKLTAQLPFLYVKLEHGVAGRKGHLADLPWIPGGYDQPSAIRIFAYRIYDTLKLIDRPSVRSSPIAPLRPVHSTQVAISIRPFAPDRHAVMRQEFDVGFAAYKPKQLE
jgi:hypothetical protein